MSSLEQTLNSQLADIRNQLALCSKRANDIVTCLYPDQLTLRSEPGRWSIAECLVHLNLTSEAVLPTIRTACDGARANSLLSDGPFRMERMGKLLKWSLEPPPRLRFNTSSHFQPLIFEPLDRVLPGFTHLQNELNQILDTANGLDLGRVRVASPFSNRIQYNLLTCFTLIAAHQRRHLWQAEEMKKWILSKYPG
jgi:hypothetical protein